MVFVILVFLAGFILWALLSGMYRPIGKFISTLYNDIEEIVEKEDERDE